MKFSFSPTWKASLTVKLVLIIVIAVNVIGLVRGYSVDEIKKTHQWAVSVEGGEEAAQKLARDLGLTYKSQVGTLDVYILEGKWPESHRVSPFAHPIRKREAHTASQSWLSEMSDKLKQQQGVRYSERQIAKKRVKRHAAPSSSELNFNDPIWPKSWYLIKGAKGSFDMNVQAAWRAGYTGMNIVVSILDDGIERDHPDLAPNYDPLASKDINGEDDDPTPRYDSVDSNRHGTRCAGQVAAVANNNICTVGVAFNAKIGGVRMLDGGITDAVEAASLSLNPQHIDIYSASWGPDDNGKALDGPGALAKDAFVQGVLKGRGGKGSIFVWASGNGGNADDSCACDGYANSIFTLSISSASENGVKPWYLEECASTIATTYSSGEPSSEKQVITVDLHHGCTERHTGTSASAPMAAGMVALALEANPKLTWRDVQHIVAETSRPEPLNDAQWLVNGVGRKVSTRYGYGLMDGWAMVQLAQKWVQVPEQRICATHLDEKPRDLVGQTTLTLEATSDACQGTGDYVRYLEHVQAQISMDFSRRGDLSIYLTSPSGTRSQLIPRRSHDRDAGEYKEWPFMSVHFWGEQAVGKWKLEIQNTGAGVNRGVFKLFRLVLYGTEFAPEASTLARKDPVKQGKITAGSIAGSNQSVLATGPACHPECDTAVGCTGQSAADCKVCKHYKTSSGVCVPSCLPQFYRDDASKTCIACSPHCTRCASPTVCLTCQQGMFLSPNRSECLHECPTGYCQDDSDMACDACPGRCPQGFYEKWIWGCAPCHETCRTCAGAGPESCLTCRTGLSRDQSSKKCQAPKSKCASNEFELGNHKCTRCHINCKTCSGGTEADCTTCLGMAYFHNGTCVEECPPHFAPFESKDPTDESLTHRQCMYCFDGTEAPDEDGTCMPAHLRNAMANRGLWSALDSHSATLTIFATSTCILVLFIILFLIRMRKNYKYRLMNGKQYVQLNFRVMSRVGFANAAFSSANSLSKGDLNDDEDDDEIYGAKGRKAPRNIIQNSSSSGSSPDILEFDTMPEIPVRTTRSVRFKDLSENSII